MRELYVSFGPPNRWFWPLVAFCEVFEVWERWISIIGGAGTAFPCVQWHFNHWLKGILENFPFRSHLPPKTSKLKSVKQTGRVLGYSDQQDALQGVSKVGQLFCTTYGFLRYGASKFPNFTFFPYFPIKRLKSTFLCVTYSPWVTLQSFRVVGKGEGPN